MSVRQQDSAYPRDGRGRKPLSHQFIGDTERKFCRGCAQWLELDRFGASARILSDGKASRCRECIERVDCARKVVRDALGIIGKNRIAEGQRYGRVLTLASGRRKRVRLYVIWESMRQRCHYPRQKSYYRYGGRGIQVCNEWREDYDAFRAWAVSHGYGKNVTLDRIDVNGNYEPANCRWLSPKQQQWNSRVVIFLTVRGVTKPLPQWAHENGINPEVYRVRRREGWTDEQIVLTPLLPGGHFRPGVQHKPRGRRPSFLLSAHPSSSQE